MTQVYDYKTSTAGNFAGVYVIAKKFAYFKFNSGVYYQYLGFPIVQFQSLCASTDPWRYFVRHRMVRIGGLGFDYFTALAFPVLYDLSFNV